MRKFKFKKAISIVLALTMAFCCNICAFAENAKVTPLNTAESNSSVRSLNGNIYGANNDYITGTGSFYVHCTGSSTLADILVTVVSSNTPNTIMVTIYRPGGSTPLFDNQTLVYSNKTNQNRYTATNLTAGDYLVVVSNTNGGCSVAVSIEDYYVVHG